MSSLGGPTLKKNVCGFSGGYILKIKRALFKLFSCAIHLKSYCQLQNPVSHRGDSKSHEVSPPNAETIFELVIPTTSVILATKIVK